MEIHNLQLVDGIDSDNNNYNNNNDNNNNNNNGELVNGRKLVMVQLIKSSCHWYYKKGRKNGCSATSAPPHPFPSPPSALVSQRKAPQSVAIIVTGTTSRFLLNSTVNHVLNPLIKNGFQVDYYALLTTSSSPAYRQEMQYTSYTVGDPLFRNKDISKTATDAIANAGAKVQAFLVQQEAVDLEVKKLEQKRNASRLRYAGRDSDFLFPTLDLSAGPRQMAANRNMIKVISNQQYLWDEKLLPIEATRGRYNYIMILGDDTYWLQDFNLTKLIATGPDADAYALSCDAREPRMHPQEMNDHGIILSREKAGVIGRYLSSLLSMDLQRCHDSITSLGPLRGCNSEMLLKWMLQQNNFTVQLAPQSLIPFQRSLVVQGKDKKERYCFHKLCQSIQAPLNIPTDMLQCKDINTKHF